MLKCQGYCLCYNSERNLETDEAISGHLKRRTTTDELAPLVVFSTDEFARLMEQIRGYNLRSIQIPVYDFKEQPFQNMANALELLTSAYRNLSSGNELAAVRDIRNIFLNYLTIAKKTATEEGMKSERFLRDEFKEYIINRVPGNSKQVYKDIIKGLERGIRSICDVLSKFIHETDDVLISVPFHRDLEFLYLSSSSIITYLARQFE